MSEPVWNKFLTERDKEVFSAAGYGQRAGFGERPAIIVIDVNYNFTGDKPEPILESIKRWPNSCGEDGWESMRHIKKLLDAALLQIWAQQQAREKAHSKNAHPPTASYVR